MNNFQYYNPSRIIFGAGSQQELGSLLKEYHATSLLLVYSGDFIKDLGIFTLVKNACEEQNIAFYEDGSVVPNPKVELVRDLIALGKEHAVDFILAVGGGSAIDTAKAVSIGIPYDGDVWDFFEGTAAPSTAVPSGVITTLPASGSETSNCSIISNGIAKLGFEDNRIIPRFAIMNPEYTLGLPPYQTSCGIADILSHLLERYFTSVSHVDTTDYLLEGAIQALMVNGLRLMEQPDDYDARAEVQWLASIAHNNLLDTGRTSDWGSHRIEHEISAQYGLTHGEGMAVVMTAWCRYMAKEKPEKLAQLAARVFHVDSFCHSKEAMALILSEKLEDFFRRLHLKTHLAELEIDSSHFEEMALRATSQDTSPVGHYIPLDKSRILEILELAV